MNSVRSSPHRGGHLDEHPAAERRGERKTSAPEQERARRTSPLDAGPFAADVASFGLYLAAGSPPLICCPRPVRPGGAR
jgi:hypothetical protein